MTRFEQRVLTGRRAAAPDGSLSDVAGLFLSRPAIPPDDPGRLEFSLDDLVRTLVAVFRRHPHIGNVIGHVCGERWGDVERALEVILNPGSAHDELSPLAENILELLWAERGITGRILKPYFLDLLAKLLPAHPASRLRAHVASLALEMEMSRCTAPRVSADRPSGQETTAIDAAGKA